MFLKREELPEIVVLVGSRYHKFSDKGQLLPNFSYFANGKIPEIK